MRIVLIPLFLACFHATHGAVFATPSVVVNKLAASRGERGDKIQNRVALMSATTGSQISAPSRGNVIKDSLWSLTPVLAASFCAAAIMYPLDLVRALKMANAGSNLSTKQLLVQFKDAHGISGFFTQGLAPELVRSTWMRFIKFGLYPLVHMGITGGQSDTQGSTTTKALAAMITSVPEAMSIMPFEIAKITLQLDAKNLYKNDMFKAMGAVMKDRGIAGFAVGYPALQLRQTLWTTGYFASIKFFDTKVAEVMDFCSKGSLQANFPDASKTFRQLSSGFLAGVFGASLNTPFDIVRTIIQKRTLGSTAEVGVTSFVGVIQEIVQAKGFTGLYAGFKFKAIHLGGGGALMAFLIPLFQYLLNFDTKSPPIAVKNTNSVTYKKKE